MQLFAIGTTSQRADYIKISTHSEQQCCQQNSTKLQILCPPYLKNGFSQVENFLYSFLMLSDLAWINFWEPSAKQWCHFTTEAQNTFSVLIRSFLNVLSCNFIFNSSVLRLFRNTNFNLI
ncbi:hypothetical protein O3M35_003410 [Rhynocoris fuscipes]|uniref:Uncharacterized protein n=1 Tax=Rhynocoris fuscipes TaxID=488301 RepID=A0AAW1CMV2_9HEMI